MDCDDGRSMRALIRCDTRGCVVAVLHSLPTQPHVLYTMSATHQQRLTRVWVPRYLKVGWQHAQAGLPTLVCDVLTLTVVRHSVCSGMRFRINRTPAQTGRLNTASTTGWNNVCGRMTLMPKRFLTLGVRAGDGTDGVRALCLVGMLLMLQPSHISHTNPQPECDHHSRCACC